MNITRRSLGFSLILHCSLLGTGIFWAVWSSHSSGEPIATVESPKVKVTAVRLATPEPAKAPRPERPQPRDSRPAPRSVRAAPIPTRAMPPAAAPVEPVVRPVKVAPGKPVAPEYPLALRPPSSSRPTGAAPASRRERPRDSVPLWSPENDTAPLSSPTPGATPGPPPGEEPAGPPPGEERGGQPGQGDSDGVVVEAHPKGRVDLNTPGFMALKSAEIVAVFEIASDGSVTSVKLSPGTGIAAVDAEVIAFLKTVPWEPKTVGGIPVAGMQELDFSKEAR